MKKIPMKPNQFLLMAGLSLSVLTFSSCDKEDILPAGSGAPATGTPGTNNPTTPPVTTPPVTPPPTNTTPPVTVNSLVKQLGTQVFKYDAQNRLVDVSYTSQADLGFAVEYEGDKPVKLKYKNGNHLIYTYNGDKVAEAVIYTPDNKVNFHYWFEYSGDRLAKRTTISYIGSQTGHLSIIAYNYDAKGNLTENVLTWSPSNSPDDMRGPSIIKWGDYDDKPNPMPYVEHFFYLPGIKVSSNNPGSRDVFGNGENKELYTYTYHASGMPKDRTLRLPRAPHLEPYTEHYSY